MVDRGGAETIVACGDAWARGVLVRALPKRLRGNVITLEGRGTAAETDRALLEEELGELFTGRRSAGDQALMGIFLAQRARRKEAVEGMAAAVTALQRGQARALLLNHLAQPTQRLWVGAKPSQIAVSATDLRAFGVNSVEEVAADSALLRALVGTGAELVVLPREELPLEDGVGVVLRYTGTE